MSARQPVGFVLRAAYVVAMRVLQSDLYPKLDAEERAAVDLCIEDYLNTGRRSP